MWRKCVFLLLVSALIVVPFSVHADNTSTVCALSGRYSLDVPVGWVVDQTPAGSSQFPGENLTVASSADMLAAYENHQSIDDGSIIVIHFFPVNMYSNYYTFEPLEPDALVGKMGDDLLEVLDVRGARMQVDGYPARRYRERSGGSFVGAEVFGETLVVVDYFIFKIFYTGPEMAEIETIVDTLKFYTEATAGMSRSALVVEDATFDLDIDWLVARWHFGIPFGSSRVMAEDSSMGYYYVILTDKFDEFLPLLYPPLENGHMTFATTADLPGLYVMVGIHPYDQLFGSADVPVDQSRRETAFSEIKSSMLAAAAGNPELAVVGGNPALTASLDQVFGKPNQGQLTIVDANYNFYSILVAGPTDTWDQIRADELLAGFNMELPTPLASGEIGIGAQVGLYAPDFTLALVDGSTVSLSDYRGKVVLLNFWASWCEPCVEEMDEFQEYYTEHSDDAVILAVDFREPTDVVTQFVEENELTFPVALDLDGAVNDLYRINRYPTTIIIIDADGIIHAMPFAQANSVHTVDRWINAAQRD